MTSNLNATIKEARFLCEQARYEDALQKINSFYENVPMSNQESRVLICENADILSAQGYVKKCEVVLKEALTKSASSFDGQIADEEERSWHELLRAKEALAMLETNGYIDQALRVREELMGLYLNVENGHEQYNDFKVEYNSNSLSDSRLS
jgi:hypothetical protein